MSLPNAASANTTRFACDTPGGRVSEFRIPAGASQFRVSGTIQPALFRAHERFIPLAIVSLRNSELGNAMIIRAAAEGAEAGSAFVSVSIKTGDDEQRTGVGTLAVDNVVNFEITYVQGGQSRFVIGEQTFTGTADLGSSFDLTISCSTGDFIFDDIYWQSGIREVGTPRG